MNNELYRTVYDRSAYTEWDSFEKTRRNLEKTVLSVFENKPSLKLVGSASTKTMRRGEEDLDFFVAFDDSFDDETFINNIQKTGLELGEINIHKKYKYMRLTGKQGDSDFVLVPIVDPKGNIESYEQDAFYHPDFINSNRAEDHSYNTILAKWFFSQIGVYKRVKGIGSELLTLRFRQFDEVLRNFLKENTLRVNFSGESDEYSDAPLVIDYPFLGKRSFTEKVTDEDYEHIQENAEEILRNPKQFIEGHLV